MGFGDISQPVILPDLLFALDCCLAGGAGAVGRAGHPRLADPVRARWPGGAHDGALAAADRPGLHPAPGRAGLDVRRAGAGHRRAGGAVRPGLPVPHSGYAAGAGGDRAGDDGGGHHRRGGGCGEGHRLAVQPHRAPAVRPAAVRAGHRPDAAPVRRPDPEHRRLSGCVRAQELRHVPQRSEGS
ncbi:hypothetical protein G6F31_013313 [Rhizopus arrhizus]|nr:hypothetical protein G6F31_013313 [Rhizopus arrhizus]